LLVDILDLGANLQAAAEMARFRHDQVPNELSLESPLFNTLGAQLSGMGHKVKSVNGSSMGGVQSILFTANPAAAIDGNQAGDRNQAGDGNKKADHVGGFYRGGSDHRKDGAAVGW
jgi:gamma-glutamyltranspeptidase/glutathione hydrolase